LVRMDPPEAKSRAKRPRQGSGDVIILDGGLGLELKRRKSQGQDVAYNLQLFSSAALLETPGAIRELHADYLAAGAEVLTTATFAVTRFYLDKAGHSHRLTELARLAVQLAREAAQGCARVAGSIPPLGESFRADLAPRDLEGQYRELTAAMVDVDLWLCETMASLREAEIAVAACREAAATTPVWMSFVLRRGPQGRVELLDGSSLQEAAGLAQKLGAEALLFNCSTPQLIGEALEEVPKSSLRLGGYGNFWEEHKPDWSIDSQETEMGKGDAKACGLRVRDISTEEYVANAKKWVAVGASIVGGCCGIGPEHIRAVAAAFAATPH